MLPTHVTDTLAVFLMSLWAIVWLFFIVLGQNAKRKLPLHHHLVWYSTAVFISITFFYWAIFSDIGSLTGYLSVSNLLNDTGVFLSVLGAISMILSRWGLRELTVGEVVFARCESRISTGVYRYFKHPMYLGLFLILLGSFVLYPNFFALFFMALTWFLVEKKKEIEGY